MTEKDYELEYLLKAIVDIGDKKSIGHWLLDMALRQEEARPTSTGDAMAFLRKVKEQVDALIYEAEFYATYPKQQVTV